MFRLWLIESFSNALDSIKVNIAITVKVMTKLNRMVILFCLRIVDGLGYFIVVKLIIK